MKAVVRLGDSESHSCNTTTSSENVFVNGKGVCRVSDKVCCGLSFPPHPSEGIITQGSSTVFVNGKPIARLGDPTSHTACGGGSLEGGSPNVFVGDWECGEALEI